MLLSIVSEVSQICQLWRIPINVLGKMSWLGYCFLFDNDAIYPLQNEDVKLGG